jgi:hypothetical protein
LKFTAQANNVRDLVINSMTVSLVTGDKNNVSTLQVVVDGNVVDEDNFNDGEATLSSLGIRIPKGGTKDIALRLNIDNGYNATGLKIRVTFNAGDIEDSKGNNAGGNYPITVDSVSFHVIDSATLYVSRDTDTPDEAIIPGNSNVKYEVARFKFKAVDDDALIQELALVNVDRTFDADAATGDTTPNTDADNVVSKVYIYDTNGNELGNAALVSGVAYFTFSKSIELPEDQDVTLIVKVQPASIDDT